MNVLGTTAGDLPSGNVSTFPIWFREQINFTIFVEDWFVRLQPKSGQVSPPPIWGTEHLHRK